MRPEVHFHFAFDEIDGHSKIDSELLTFAEVTKSDDEIDESHPTLRPLGSMSSTTGTLGMRRW